MDFLKSFQKGSSISIKLLIIGLLIVFFIPAAAMVQNLIEERADRQESTIQEVSEKWGQEQIIEGPILHVPYANGENVSYAYFLPENLKISGKINSELRSRGIYDVPLYESDLTFSGSFNHPDLNSLSINPETVLWDQAFVAVEIPDMRGITQKISLNWDSSQLTMDSGISSDEVRTGVGTGVTLNPTEPKTYDFEIGMSLRGSEQLYFMPLGKETTVDLSSDWAHPSFDGAFLPLSHEIGANGFVANWSVLDLNTDFPHMWKDHSGTSLNSEMNAFGVKLFLPVDVYQKTTRSAKYAIAVIALVFLVVFMVEVTSKKRIHPLQYILIGLALIIFYTLLLSLAEYTHFKSAYMVASLAIIIMVTMFIKSVMKSWKIGLINGVILAVLYAFVYVLLQMQDLTLLIGSVGLFVILAGMMYGSRQIDWYKEEEV